MARWHPTLPASSWLASPTPPWTPSTASSVSLFQPLMINRTWTCMWLSSGCLPSGNLKMKNTYEMLGPACAGFKTFNDPDFDWQSNCVTVETCLRVSRNCLANADIPCHGSPAEIMCLHYFCSSMCWGILCCRACRNTSHGSYTIDLINTICSQCGDCAAADLVRRHAMALDILFFYTFSDKLGVGTCGAADPELVGEPHGPHPHYCLPGAARSHPLHRQRGLHQPAARLQARQTRRVWAPFLIHLPLVHSVGTDKAGNIK